MSGWKFAMRLEESGLAGNLVMENSAWVVLS
jgi:hypothetical protein